MEKKYYFIINPISGNPSAPDIYTDAINKVFGEAKAPYEIFITNHAGEGREIASKYAGSDAAIIAVGGDGTINEVAGEMVNAKAVFGVIPKGSGNGIARELGMPLNALEACKTLLESPATNIDVGSINGHYFFNIAGIGLDAKVGIEFNKRRKRGRGRIHYFYITLGEFLRLSPPDIEIETGTEKIRTSPMLVSIANSKQYGSNAIVAPTAKMNDGIMSIVIFQKMSIPQFLFYVPFLFMGAITKCPHVKEITASKCTIRLPKPLPYHTDGECYTDNATLEFKVLPKALRVLSPTIGK
ncbi:diacylglycerol/lipid kinase family protein [Elusimicrobiota bacterium]